MISDYNFTVDKEVFSKYIPRYVVTKLTRQYFMANIFTYLRDNEILKQPMPYEYTYRNQSRFSNRKCAMYSISGIKSVIDFKLRKLNKTYTEKIVIPRHKKLLEILDVYEKLIKLNKCSNTHEIISEIKSMVDLEVYDKFLRVRSK